MSKFCESTYGLTECAAAGVKSANAYFTPDCGHVCLGVKSANACFTPDCGHVCFGVKSATALVYSGRLSPAVEAEGFFDVIVDAASLLSGEGESHP